MLLRDGMRLDRLLLGLVWAVSIMEFIYYPVVDLRPVV